MLHNPFLLTRTTLSRVGVVVGITILMVIQIVRYPIVTAPKASLAWPAVHEYFGNSFRDVGFGLECRIDPVACRLIWAPAAVPKSRGIQPTVVYGCDTDSELKSADVFAKFFAEAEQKTGRQEAVRALARLMGFFESGLRRTCDRSVLSARLRSSSAFGLKPFMIDDTQPEADFGPVTRLDASYGIIPTGLPMRPSYTGEVFAKSGWAPDPQNSTLVRISQQGVIVATSVLTATANRTCGPMWPGSASDSDCSSISVFPCDPSIADASCRVPVLAMYAGSAGRVVVRAGRNAEVRPLLAALAPMNEDELTVMGQRTQTAEQLFARGTKSHPGFTIETVRGNRELISRVRLVNGRWERWFLPQLASWLEPVVNDYERMATLKQLPSMEAPVELSLDVALHSDLERQLAEWMATHAERATRDHLAAVHFGRKDHLIGALPGETDHRRPAPSAGVTVLNAPTGEILAVASYPPASSLTEDPNGLGFAGTWEARLVGASAPVWAKRNVLEALQDRVTSDTNENFSLHPIGSTFKPILLSLTLDARPPGGTDDGVDRLFNLVVAGHVGSDNVRNGGNAAFPLDCKGATCRLREAEAIAGMPAGPWGREEGATHGGPWIDRWEFLLDSCNKYAVTLGTLSLLDWSKRGSNSACCWNSARDKFGFVPVQVRGQATPTAVISSADQVPPLGPWAQIYDGRLSAGPQLADAPIFNRLQLYYGVTARSQTSPYDGGPWQSCLPKPPKAPSPPNARVGRVAASELRLTGYPASASFTNVFTGSGRNWWTNIKLAEAYSRIAANREVEASFCATDEKAAALFQNASRHRELVKILSLQRTAASWVKTPTIDQWQGGRRGRVTLSKTGTSLRSEREENLGVFVMFIGSAPELDARGLPERVDDGLIVVAHVDDIGSSEMVTRLVNELFPVLQRRLRP